MKYKLIGNLKLAIRQTQVSGSRFDNSAYWKEYYSKKEGRRDTVREAEYAKFLKFLSYRAAKVLDLASGCGFLPLEMNRVGFEVTGVDRNQSMIDEAVKYLSRYNVKLPIINADVTDLPFEKKSFDVVTGMSILEHIPMGEVGKRFFPEISRVLRDDGLLLLHMPVKTKVTQIKKWYRNKILKDLPDWARDDDGDVTHTMWLSVREYADLIEKNGFKIDYVRFNYSRSNEKLLLIRLMDSFLSLFDGSFLKWGDRPSLRNAILSRMAVSAAFVCHKVL